MAQSKSSKKKNKERVPTDDPQVVAIIEKVEALEVPALKQTFRSWLDAPERKIDWGFPYVANACAQDVRGPEIAPHLIACVALVDEQRALALLSLLVRMIAGEHQRWLEVRAFDVERVVEDRVCRDNQSVIAASFDALAAFVSDPSPDVRARIAFVLPWLGTATRTKAIERLRALVSDRDPCVRASAVVSLGLLGDRDSIVPTSTLFSDEDERVRLAAAIAVTYVTRDVSEAVLALLEGAFVKPPPPWTSFAFMNGQLSAWAVQRYGLAGAADEARSARVYEAMLAGDSVGALVPAAVAGLFIEYTRGAALTAAQRAVAAKIVGDPAMQTPLVTQALRARQLVGDPQFTVTGATIDEFRARVGLPRPPPAAGPLELVSVPSIARPAQPAQHWLADFSIAPNADEAEPIARAIASTIPTDKLVEFFIRWGPDFDGTNLPRERTAALEFEVPLPSGITLRDGRLIGEAEGWPDRFRVWLAEREAEGWIPTNIWWYGVQVDLSLIDRVGRWFTLAYGHDWNSGNPDYTYVRATPRARHRLTPLVARAARDRDPAEFDRVFDATLDAVTAKGSRDLWIVSRMAWLAVEVFALSGVVPPPMYDRAVQVAQRVWTYAIGPFRAYTRLLPAERREALVLTCVSEQTFALIDFYGACPTPAVFEALAQKMKQNGSYWTGAADRVARWWAYGLGEEAAAAFVAEIPKPAPKKRR